MRQKLNYWMSRIQAHMMRLLSPKTLAIVTDKPIISFTFDDVPDSAFNQGAAILEKYGLRGTFYIAGSLVGVTESRRQLINEANINQLIERGHEIGCHTFSHSNVAKITGAELQRDIERNRGFLQHILGTRRGGHGALANFAYPYNAVSYFAWRRLAKSYRSCRAGENRINRGMVSPQMLYGMEIRQPEAEAVQLTRHIDTLKAQPGWLIFFTHDISDTPTPYGCTMATFEALVHYAVQSGAVILTVDEALDRFMPLPQL